MKRTVSGSALAIACSWAAAYAGQDQPQRPTFRTEANYVRVDAYPTIDGVPVEDLTQADFQVLEDGVVQKIEQFERIQIRAADMRVDRRDPNTMAESRAMLDDPKARVFVLFLDVGHVGQVGSRIVSGPLVSMLDNLIGPDDLIGVMTPTMSAADVTFARKATSIRSYLDREWWGEQDLLNPKDPIEQKYCACYPPESGEPPSSCSALARQMIVRRREKLTLDSMEDLVRFLGGVREERKAVIAITQGWLLYRPDSNLARSLNGQVPGIPQVGVDPKTGRLTSNARNNPFDASRYDCDRDRVNLAQIDDDAEFRRILGEANRANTSFYPVDPRGLVVFESAIGPDPPLPLEVDAARVRGRLDSLKTLADNTDGIAVVNSNDLSSGLKRVVSDLSSYYLLGYYSTNAKADGTFRRITVRVARPRVQVRARRGYVAATAAELERVRTAAAAASPEAAAAEAEARAIEAVVGPLATFTRELPLRIQIAATRTGVWAVGEAQWKDGGEADVMLIAPGGATVATAHTPFPAGSGGFRTALVPGQPLAPGEYTVRVRARGTAAGSIPANDALRFTLSKDAAVGAVFIRRGPATANRDVPTADLRFRRGETLRVEVPATAAGDATARLLDKTGKPLGVPVTAATRTDADGSRWHTAQLALAPLAAGDYVIEVEASGSRTLVAFRVVS